MNVEKKKLIEKVFCQNKGYARTKDIMDKGVHSYYIYQLEELGIISRIKRGLFKWEEYDFGDMEEMIEVSKIVKDGVICLGSALSYYDLTTYNPWQYYVAIHRDSHKPKLPEYPPINLVFFSDKEYMVGISSIKVSGHKVSIYDMEKSICDCIRYRNKIGIDIMKESLRNYVTKKNRNITKLLSYAEELRVASVLKEYLEVLL